MNIRSSPSPATAAMPAADVPSIPVTRLFDQRDILFLRSAPGYNRRMETGFRRRRCRIFRATRADGSTLPYALCLGTDSGVSVSVPVPLGTG
jgi:hypothetical protein